MFISKRKGLALQHLQDPKPPTVPKKQLLCSASRGSANDSVRHTFASIPPKMDLTVSYRPNPLLSTSSTSLLNASQGFSHLRLPTKRRPRISRRKPIFRASASNGFDGSFWRSLTRSVRRGSDQFWSKFGEAVKKETGFDLDAATVKVGEFVEQVNEGVKKGEAELTRFSSEFVNWNRWERWKDFKNWDPKRIGALVIYTFIVIISFNKIYIAIRAPFRYRQMEELTNAYMETLIPDPSPDNIKRFKKGIWKKATPEGLKMKKYIKGLDGTLIHDNSFVGQDAWEDVPNPQKNVKQTIDNNVRLTAEEKKGLKEDLGISDEVQGSRGTWRERLNAWKAVLMNEEVAERLGSLNAKYVVDFDMKEVENSLRKDVVEKVTATQRTRALWISKRWWCYRPKLPYTYFLEKLDCSEVAAVVFTEDLKRLYITMKEGFPSEYIVDIPLDPYLFEIISSSGIEVDLLQKRQIHYFIKFVVALVPGVLMLCFIGEAVMFLRVTSKRYIHKKYNQLNDMAYAENFTMPVGTVSETKSMYKEVVVGGDVWDLLDELMLYMRNPLQYYEREVPFVRGVLLSGPPGTGKTLFARTLSKKSGLPFIYASGAEFTSGSGGPAKINEMFNTARKNAPAFIFIDEIDAIAGRHTKKDLRRKSTYMALLEQLDGEKVKTGVDRFSAKQAVIFICATNIPEELDPDFVRPGRIDRRVHIGLPNEKQRVQIFGVHSAGQQLAEDVDFKQLVFRTVGYSGADIRNLVNEAAIMSVRKGHSKIYQEDIVDVLDKQLLEGMGVLLTEDEQQKVEARVSEEKRRLLAVHEAGHILLAHLFPRFDWHAFSQLLPGGKEIALSVFYPREDMLEQAYTTFGYLKMQMVVAHGGRCAERIVYGDNITDGGNDDLIKITRIAREMVISPQNKRLGLLNLIKQVRPMGPRRHNDKLIKYQWDDPNVIPANMTPEVSELFTRELTRYIEETEELAMNGLRDNRHILDMIAEELFEKSRITGLEVIDKLKGLSPIMFEDFVKPFQINLEEEGPLPHNDRLRYQPGDVYPAPLHRC